MRICPAASRVMAMASSALSPVTESKPAIKLALIAMVVVLSKVWPHRVVEIIVEHRKHSGGQGETSFDSHWDRPEAQGFRIRCSDRGHRLPRALQAADLLRKTWRSFRAYRRQASFRRTELPLSPPGPRLAKNSIW